VSSFFCSSTSWGFCFGIYTKSAVLQQRHNFLWFRCQQQQWLNSVFEPVFVAWLVALCNYCCGLQPFVGCLLLRRTSIAYWNIHHGASGFVCHWPLASQQFPASELFEQLESNPRIHQSAALLFVWPVFISAVSNFVTFDLWSSELRRAYVNYLFYFLLISIYVLILFAIIFSEWTSSVSYIDSCSQCAVKLSSTDWLFERDPIVSVSMFPKSNATFSVLTQLASSSILDTIGLCGGPNSALFISPPSQSAQLSALPWAGCDPTSSLSDCVFPSGSPMNRVSQIVADTISSSASVFGSNSQTIPPWNISTNPLSFYNGNLTVPASILNLGRTGRPWYSLSMWSNTISPPRTSSIASNSVSSFPFSKSAAASQARFFIQSSSFIRLNVPESLPPLVKVELQFNFPWFGRHLSRVYISPVGSIHMSPAWPCCSTTGNLLPPFYTCATLHPRASASATPCSIDAYSNMIAAFVTPLEVQAAKISYASSPSIFVVTFSNVVLLNSTSPTTSFNITLLPSGRVFVDYSSFVHASNVVWSNSSKLSALPSKVSFSSQYVQYINAASGILEEFPNRTSNRPSLIGIRPPSVLSDSTLANWPLRNRDNLVVSNAPSIDALVLALINSGDNSSSIVSDASIAAAMAWRATESFPNTVRDGWNTSINGIYPPFHSLRDLDGQPVSLGYCHLGTDVCMAPQFGPLSGNAPVYFLFPGVACHDIVRFRCRFGNIASSFSSDGLVDAQYDPSKGALVCRSPAAAASMTVVVQLLANGVPLSSSRPLLYSFRPASLWTASQLLALSSPSAALLCESCFATVATALSSASIPAASGGNAVIVDSPSQFSVYFSQVCPLDCSGRWTVESSAVSYFDSCSQCVAFKSPDSALDSQNICFGPFDAAGNCRSSNLQAACNSYSAAPSSSGLSSEQSIQVVMTLAVGVICLLQFSQSAQRAVLSAIQSARQLIRNWGTVSGNGRLQSAAARALVPDLGQVELS
jgi:hypothetical protein